MARSTTAHLRQTLRLALPASLAQLGLILMGVVDTAMVGRLGAAPLAGVALGNALFFAPAVFCMGLVMALDPLVAQAYGARRWSECGSAYVQGVRLALWLSVPLGLLTAGLAAVPRLLGVQPPAAEATEVYLGLLALSTPPLLLFIALRSFLQGLGQTRPALVAVAFGNLVNLGLNWVLIYGHLGLPRLGLAGCAIATVLSRGVMVAALAWSTYGGRRHARYGVPGAATRVDLRRLWRVVKLGAPIGGQLFLEVGLFAAVALMMGWLGARALAAHQVALQLAALTFMLSVGIGMAGGIRVGHAVGAGQGDEAARAAWVAVAAGAAVMLVGAVAFVTVPRALIRLFTPDPAIVEAGASLLRIAALFQLADGVQVVAVGCLRGAGETVWPMRVHLVASVLLGLPVAALLGFGADLGARGLWWGLTVGLVTSAVLLVWRLAQGPWLQRRVVFADAVESQTG